MTRSTGMPKPANQLRVRVRKAAQVGPPWAGRTSAWASRVASSTATCRGSAPSRGGGPASSDCRGPVADGHEARERLEIDVEELARPLPLVARAEPIAPRLLEAPQPGVLQEPADGRHRALEAGGDLRAREASGGPQVDDLADPALGRAPRRAVRPGGAIEEPRWPLGEKPPAPLVERAGADMQGGGDQRDGLPVLEQPPDRFGSPQTVNRAC
jgi:hypothetical protein